MNANEKTLLDVLRVALEETRAEPVFPDGTPAYLGLAGDILRLHNEAGEVVASFQLVPVRNQDLTDLG